MINIGIVDDEEQMRNMIEKNIRQSVTENDAAEIVMFSSGEAFLESIRAGQKFDILFTDIQMAEMDGMELGKEIRKNPVGNVSDFYHFLCGVCSGKLSA